MYKEDKGQQSFYSGYLYDQAAPKEHFLRKLSEAVDFRFVNGICRAAYSEIGRPGQEPLKLFKIRRGRPVRLPGSAIFFRRANTRVRPYILGFSRR